MGIFTTTNYVFFFDEEEEDDYCSYYEGDQEIPLEQEEALKDMEDVNALDEKPATGSKEYSIVEVNEIEGVTVCMHKPSLCMENSPKVNSRPLYKRTTIESKRRGREEPPNQLYEQQWIAEKGEICRWVQSNCRCIVYPSSKTALPVHQCRFRSTISLFLSFKSVLNTFSILP